MDSIVDWAAREAERLLAPLGRRWVHTQAVAEVARQLSAWDDDVDGPVLVAAAYLHDLGYAPALRDTGHHGIDGARYLAALGHDRLSRLVAHHSGADHEAGLLGLGEELADFPLEVSITADALTYCDVTTDAAGRRVTVPERFGDVRRRYGIGHLVTMAMQQAYPDLMRVVASVESRCSGDDRSIPPLQEMLEAQTNRVADLEPSKLVRGEEGHL